MKAFAACALLLAALPTGCGGRKETASPPAAASAPAAEADCTARTRRPADARHPVLWLGLDGLDFEILDRLAAAGKMPTWKRITSEGYTAKLASFVPLISPILWTTAATGVAPDVHRVLDFQEVDPKTGTKVPISGFSRAAPAVWNMASAAGRKVGVVGWWATHPAEEVNGFFISDHATPILFEKLPLAGAAFPAALEQGVAQVLERDGRIEARDLAPYLDMPEKDIEAILASGAGMESPVGALRRILVATRVGQRTAVDLYDRNFPDLMAFYLEGTDEIGHIFGAATPPKLSCARDEDLARYGRVVDTYYAMIDKLLGQWMRRAQEDGATLLIHSDHGFKWGDDRPCGFASGNWATAAFWHRFDGVFAAWGSRVRSSSERGTARIFDVAPTVLALLDLPPGKAMPGKPIAAAFTDLPETKKAADFSKLEVRRLPAQEISAQEASEYTKKLLALGYLSPSQAKPLAPTGGDRPGLTEGAWNNLGVYFRETAKNTSAARDAFEKSLALSPDYYSPMFNMAVLYREKGDAKSAEEWLFRSLAALKSDPEPAVAGWAREYEKGGKAAAAKSLLERAAREYPQSEGIARELAMLRYRAKDCGGAAAALSPFEAGTKEARTLNDLALFQTCLVHREEVIRLLERSLALDPNQPEVARTLQNVRNAR
ncbi:MAG TPA: alkaline phosphatase family protein [Thermoanaerobaculia bacterium]|nr:alkaline phosphatase family protein [Thermoanaerobaculia bacterium]